MLSSKADARFHASVLDFSSTTPMLVVLLPVLSFKHRETRAKVLYFYQGDLVGLTPTAGLRSVPLEQMAGVLKGPPLYWSIQLCSGPLSHALSSSGPVLGQFWASGPIILCGTGPSFVASRVNHHPLVAATLCSAWFIILVL